MISRLASTARRRHATCILFFALSGLVGACGGGDGEKPNRALLPSKDRPVISVVRALTRGAKEPSDFAPSARVKAGDSVQALIRVLPQAAGQPLRIRLKRATPTRWTVTAKLGDAPTARSELKMQDKGLKLSRLVYTCRITNTFCPGRASKKGTDDVTLKFPGRAVPVTVVILFGRRGEIAKPILTKLGGADDDVKALMQVQSLPPAGSGKPGAPATKASVAAGSLVRVFVRPLKGSGSRAVRVSVPKATGRRIAIRVGPKSGPPTASATIEGEGGAIRLADPSWPCELPPATSCPFTDASASKSGFSFELPMLRSPVSLLFKVEKG